MARALGGELKAVWDAPTTQNRDRKRLLRSLIEEVQLRTEPKRHLVRIVWKGGATTDRDIVRLRGGQLKATSEDTIDLVRKLAVDLDDAQIARTLNRQGRRSGLGRAFTGVAIHSLRQKNQIPGHSHRVANAPPRATSASGAGPTRPKGYTYERRRPEQTPSCKGRAFCPACLGRRMGHRPPPTWWTTSCRPASRCANGC
jgi:hypothetical protein